MRRRRGSGADGLRARAQVDELDGLTVTTPDWWFNVRPSNTEPLLRLNAEATGRAPWSAVPEDRVLAVIREEMVAELTERSDLACPAERCAAPGAPCGPDRGADLGTGLHRVRNSVSRPGRHSVMLLDEATPAQGVGAELTTEGR